MPLVTQAFRRSIGGGWSGPANSLRT
jgi:hypothetical protein